MNTIKEWSAKIIFACFAALLILLGTSFFSGEIAPISKFVVIMGAAVILAVETGLKRFTSVFGKGNAAREVTVFISMGLIVVLGVVGLLGVAGIGVPGIIQGASDFVVVISGIWLLVEAFV